MKLYLIILIVFFSALAGYNYHQAQEQYQAELALDVAEGGQE